MRRKNSGIDRRTLLGWSVGGAAGLALPACKKSADKAGGSSGGDTRDVVIGYVSPQTGPLAAFAAADAFIVERAIKALDAKGIMVDGKKAKFQVKTVDSQSNPTKAGEAAQGLISRDKIDLMVVGHTPDTTNPVGAVCEATHTPCISSLAPIGPWLTGAPYEWTLAATKLDTMVGPVQFDDKHVGHTPLVGGQWTKGTKYPWDLRVVYNETAPAIAKTAELKAIT